MKTNTNNFYRFFSLALVIAGVFAFVNAHTGETQATSSSESEPETSTTYSRNRHTITLVLNELSDLKVEEGQRVNVGDIISDCFAVRAAQSHYRKNQATSQAAEIISVPIPR